ncbi:SMI1/KNR4 family protein [Streptomyces sp. NPDC047803]|uniref:SMI1/KNR4 family protein n=1 Tax=unclassified Streptomyces TaxID=2593676 RepID=UPI0033D27516
MDILRFRELLGRPQVDGTVQSDWEGLESRHGVSLPTDYKEFVSAFGPGCLNGQLYVFHPRASGGDDGLRLESLWRQAAQTYGTLYQSDPEMYPYSMYPADGGCIAVARSISGNYVFLLPDKSRAHHWSVVVEMGEWAVLEMSFTDFLWAALNEELYVPVLEGEPSFEPIGGLEAF